MDQLDELTQAVQRLYQEPAVQTGYLKLFHANAVAEFLALGYRDCSSASDPESEIPTGVRQVMDAFQRLHSRQHVRFYLVDPTYYSWSLQRRAFHLGAPSPEHLCKSVIFENIRCTHSDYSDATDSRYYCVVVQYVSSVNVNKLTEYVRAATNYAKGKKQYNFRLVDADTALTLTGFGNNAICPVGLNTNLPIILDHAITQLQVDT
ncbi:hypothetical protein IWQ62_002961 [Dispira parvispora]|uniref:YbaK/aminoacyl-tRNA synthetase-associated domain-containing protein n=1 Tax=Dispira parvispora TaxID=1520584 RepID=A0A9W8E255_9FUNG|nr:hypothetical protein IWQ62_002961 [Dispira parvispora]